MLERNIRVNVRHRPMFTMCLNEKASLALPDILLLLTDCMQQLYAAIATFLKCLCYSHYIVGPYVILCQMFVKSEFPLDSALVCDSDKKKFGWHFFRKL